MNPGFLETIIPDLYNVHVKVKVLSLLISLKTKHEESESNIIIHEYLIGDHTATAILSTSQNLEISQCYEIQQGYTRAIEGYLRLYSKNIEASKDNVTEINNDHNRSLIQFNRKL